MDNILVTNFKPNLRANFYDIDDIARLLTLLPAEDVKCQLAVFIALTTNMRR